MDLDGQWLSQVHQELTELVLVLSVAVKSQSSRHRLLSSAADLIRDACRDLQELQRMVRASNPDREDLAELLTKQADNTLVFTWRCLRCASVLIESKLHSDMPVIELEPLLTRDRGLVRLALTRHTCPQG